MKILHLESSPGWGGQEIRIWREALAFEKKGYHLYFGCDPKSILAEKVKEKGFPFLSLSFSKRSIISSLFSLVHFLKKQKIDLIVTHSSMDSWLGGVAGRMLHIPIIRTRHLSTKVRGGLNSYLLYNKLTDYIVTTCSEIIPMLSAQSKKAINYFQCVPTGIDTDIFASKDESMAFREKYNVGEEEILIGMVCFMRSWKGVDDFIEAAHLMREDRSVRWMIVGGGHSKKYREKVASLGLDRFIFTGHLQNPIPAIKALDIFSLLSTAHEGISQASLQAAYCKKPMITTSTGGLKEVSIPDKTGYIVPVNSPHEVVKIVEKLKSPSLRNKLGEEAKKLVLSKFTFEKTVEDMENIFLRFAK